MYNAITSIRRAISLKTFLIALASMACAFLIGTYTSYVQSVHATGTMGATKDDLIELLRNENGRLQQELYNNIAVIPMEYDDCTAAIESFYSEYPNYHYESEDGKLVMDYVVPNPEEDAAQLCDYMLNVAFRDYGTRVHNKGFTITRKN